MSPIPYYADEAIAVHDGDALRILAGMPDASVDAVVTDPPYGIRFMGRTWDRFDNHNPNAACEECGNDDPCEGFTLCSDCLEAS